MARRIYLMGFSNGAHIALDTACKDPSLVTTVVSLAGARPVDDACSEQPASVLHVHGAEDDVVELDGGKREGSCITILSALSDHREETQVRASALAVAWL